MKSYHRLEQIFAKQVNLNHVACVCHWDEAVMMPTGGAASRNAAMGALSTVMHEIIADPLVGELLKAAKDEHLESSWQRANLAWMQRAYLDATVISPQLVKKLTMAKMQSEQAWRQLRLENNWQAFAPFLQKTLNLVRESAKIRSHHNGKDCYDVLLDEYSPGLTQATLDPVFDKLQAFLPGFMQSVIAQQEKQTVIPLVGPFSKRIQKKVCRKIMEVIGFNFQHGRLDESHHPFCGGSAQDIRVTTRYHTNDVLSSIMAVSHETGHAMYESNLPVKWQEQLVGQALGMAVHESQSLLMTNQACISPEFMDFLAELLTQQFGHQEGFSGENLYNLTTRVKPSFIRVEADEVSYPLHIILRYELEKRLIAGSLEVIDLPEAWDEYMQRFFGLSTKDNDANGVMQDVHWPSGAFGYFPAYTVGAIIAAQLYSAALKQHPSISTEIGSGHFSTLLDWLKKHVHQKASSLSCDVLLKHATGRALSVESFIEHLQQRYTQSL